jgi:O-antigen ligase
MLGVLLLAPALLRPAIGIGLVAAVIAVWLAWKSVAYPLALAGLPTLVAAVVGSNPLPKGGATFLIGAWIGLGVLLAIMRGEQAIAMRGLWSAPVAMAFILVALMVLRLSSSPDEAYGSTKLQLYIADNLVFLVAAVFVGASRSSLRTFLLVTLALVAAGAFLLVAELVTGTAQQQYSGRFAITAQQGAINLGRDSANGALIAIALILMSSRLAVRLVSIAVLPVVLVAMLAAGSRGPVVAFLVGLLALIALTAASGRARRQLLLVAVVLVGAAVIVPILVPGSAIGRSLSTIIGSASGLSSNGRSHLWAEAYSAFARHPLVGLGTGGFAAVDPQQYPHNMVLEMAVELGVLGGLAVLSMLIMMLRRFSLLWRATTGSERMTVTLLISLFVSAVVNALFSGAIQDNVDVWLWGGLGVGMYARYATARSARRATIRASRRPRDPLAIANR